jgi:hypothetical protein
MTMDAAVLLLAKHYAKANPKRCVFFFCDIMLPYVCSVCVL